MLFKTFQCKCSRVKIFCPIYTYIYIYKYIYFINKYCLWHWNQGKVSVWHFSSFINTSSRSNFVSGNLLFFIVIIHSLNNGKEYAKSCECLPLGDFYPTRCFSSLKTISRVTVKLLIYSVHWRSWKEWVCYLKSWKVVHSK